MPLQETSGAASYDAFGGGVAAVPNYIEDVFSTYLYTGNGATGQTITNNIDLSTKGGMVWLKARSNVGANSIADTARGNTKLIYTNSTGQQDTSPAGKDITGFTTSGFTLGDSWNAETNTSGYTFASWTFRKQPKFFDVVTFTQSSATGYITVNHNLGSTPGCIMVKRTDAAGDWYVYHRSLGTSQVIFLNYTDPAQAASDFPSVTSTSFQFTNFDVGAQYVAYLFAHNAGGFGLTGTDNVISCGSMDGATGTTVTLGYEPQFIMYKASTTTGNWVMVDNMRGMTADGGDNTLTANTSNAEGGPTTILAPNATGFSVKSNLTSGQTYIYIAIRRGPMKVPTSGTSVYAPVNQAAGGTVTTGFPVDLSMSKDTSGTPSYFIDRLRGDSTSYFNFLTASTTDAETTGTGGGLGFDNNTGFKDALFGGGTSMVYWTLRRAPSFFDEVCYTGNGTAGRTVNHNLGVAPELIITKRRSGTAVQWGIGNPTIGWDYIMSLNTTTGKVGPDTVSYWNNTAPTSSVFTVGDSSLVNTNAQNYVAYLFATCAGVSKVGSYTGTGALQTVNCGFTSGARFIMIKRTDSTGDWYVYDSARGITSGNDPYLRMNNDLGQTSSTNYVDTTSVGFQVTAAAPAALNASGGTYIFLAIA